MRPSLSPGIFGYPGGGGSDPNFANVVLLLHCNGADGSTSFPDNSPSPKTVTANGNAQVDTAIEKYGGGAALYDGNGDYLSVPHNSGFSADADFTAELWCYPTNTSALRFLLDKRNDAATNREWFMYMGSGGAISFAGWTNAGALLVNGTSAATLSATTWTHVALTKSGTTWRLFVGGNLEVTASESGTYGTNTNAFSIGRDVGNTPSRDWLGNLDDIRITKGVARYTASFTPPASQFSDF